MIQVGKPFYITTNKGHQIRPATEYLPPSDQYIVTWRSPTGGDRHGTFGRVVKSLGQFSPTFFKLNKDDGGADKHFVGHVDIAYNETDKIALVVWSQATDTLLEGEIYGRFVAPNGTFEGEPFRVTSAEAKVWTDSNVKVSWNSKDNRFLVVWEVPGKAGFKEPYAAVLENRGKVLHRVHVSGPDPKETYDLHGVAANYQDGEWLVVYDKYWRIIDGQAHLATPPNTVRGYPAAIKLYDAFASDHSYYLVGIEPYFPFGQLGLRLWAVTLSFDGSRISSKTMIQAAAVFHGARVVYHPTHSRWLVLFSYRTSRRGELMVDARSLDMKPKVLDYRPYRVIDQYLYEELNGEPDCAIDSKDSQIMVVWSHRRHSSAGWTTDHVMGTFVDIRDGLIVVEDENGNLVEPARVYINGSWVGNVKRGWLKRPIKKGDKIVALAPVYHGNSLKKGHDPFDWGFDWAYQVLLSSSEVRDDGSYWTHEVTDPAENQILVVRKQNTLIGFNLVVSYEWDASDNWLDVIEDKIKEASRRILEASDGQFYIQHCTIYKNKGQWTNADMRVLFGEGRSETMNHIAMIPSYMNIYNLGQGYLSSGTLTHETFHYIASLGDEYEDLAGRETVCTQKRLVMAPGPYNYGGERSACPLSGGGDVDYPQKLCTNLPANPHYPKTKQGPDSCWDTLYDFYMNRNGWAKSYGRWQLRRPADRGVIMEGPKSFPVEGMVTFMRREEKVGPTKKSLKGLPRELILREGELPFLHSGEFVRTKRDSMVLGLAGDTHVLTEFPKLEVVEDDKLRLETALSGANPEEEERGIPILIKLPEPGLLKPSLWLDDGERVDRLGFIVRDERFVVPPVTVGKMIHATYYDPASLTAFHGRVRCVEGEQLTIALKPLPASFRIEVHPQPTVGEFEIVLHADQEDASSPAVTIYSSTADASFNVPMEFDDKAGSYSAMCRKECGIEDTGVIRVEFGDDPEKRLSWFLHLHIMQIQAGGGKLLGAADGFAEIGLADRTEAGTVAALTRAGLPASLPNGRRPISSPYQLTATSPYVEGTLRLLPPVPLNEGEREVIEVLGWNNQEHLWEPLESYYHTEMEYFAGIIRFFDMGIIRDPRTIYVATLPDISNLAH